MEIFAPFVILGAIVGVGYAFYMLRGAVKKSVVDIKEKIDEAKDKFDK